MLIRFIVILSVFTSFSSHAEIASRAQRAGRSSFMSQALGEGCMSFDFSAGALPCNPGSIAMKRNSHLNANIFFGNNFQASKEITKIIEGSADQSTIHNLFGSEKHSEIEAYFELGYLSETWGLSVSPLRAQSTLHSRNPALPEISIFATQEESIQFQLGSYLGHDFFFGTQVRSMHRKLVARQFFLIEAATEDGLNLVKPIDQQILFIEPSLVFAPENTEWSPQIYLSVRDFNIRDHNQELSDIGPATHVGISGQSDYGYGRLGIGLDLNWNSDYLEVSQSATISSFFQFGILRLLAHFSEDSHGTGFQVLSDWMQIGLVTNSQKLHLGWGDTATEQNTYLTLGAEI